MLRWRVVVALLAVGLLAGCSSQSSAPPKPQPKPAEFESGRTAFQKLYVAAHGWERDAQPFRLESQATTDSKGQDGKSAVWRASFASPLSHSVKPYVWSGTDVADAPARGVSFGPEDGYNPGNASTQVFDIAFLKVDSDEALKVAQQHGGDKLLQKAPDTPVLYELEWSGPTAELIWHVYYGNSRNDAKLKVDVNASTGEFIHAVK
jgi:hypothetical protein